MKDSKRAMSDELKHQPFIFSEIQREGMKSAIEEVCENRNYDLKAINVRSNHVHAVVSVQISPKLIIDAFKSYGTRKLREKFLVDRETKIWARGKSRRYLWKPRHVALAIEYVLYGQGDIILELDEFCPEIED